MTILQPHRNCLTVEKASRAAVLIDGENYFRTLADALSRARESIFILGWDIRADLVLDHARTEDSSLGGLLSRQLEREPGLHVHVLVWDWLVTYSIDRQSLPGWRFPVNHERLEFQLDDHHPLGGSHHEKLVVIDGVLAFVGGLDLAAGRYDTRDHDPADPRRTIKGKEQPAPFHDMMMMVEGPIAGAIEHEAALRWRNATAHEPAVARERRPVWPEDVEPGWRDCMTALARTRAEYGLFGETLEIRQLYVDAIGSAERLIYIENQYLTVPEIREALHDRLEAVPELVVLIISGANCEGFLETAIMDIGRKRFLQRLEPFAERCRIAFPMAGATEITVHAKAMIVDDRFLTVGSANIARRSMGLDSEMNLALETDGPDDAIRALRLDLMAEHLGTTVGTLRAAEDDGLTMLDLAMRHKGGRNRLRPLVIDLPEAAERFELAADLADPPEPLVADSLLRAIGTPRERYGLRVALARLAGLAGLAGLAASLFGRLPLPLWIGLPLALLGLAIWIAIEPRLRKRPDFTIR
ncbi:MAG: phospholipase D-like domain-containing protein [Geminicoccaceae bacterium]